MSDEELTRLLSELNETAQKLNDASDSINQTISSIEQKIVASNVGIEYWLGDLPVLEGDERHWQAFSPSTSSAVTHTAQTDTLLGFAKLGEGWRLAVAERNTETFPEYQDGEWVEREMIEFKPPTALWRGSRELRIRALEQMPALIKALSEQAKNALEVIARAKKLAG